MGNSKEHFAGFQEHTLLKHTILRAYLQAWAFKLLQRKGAQSPIFFVDGFAGAGGDENGNPGSPTIAAMVAEQVTAALTKIGKHDLRMAVIAIEQDAKTFEMLKVWLGPAANDPNQLVTLLQGTIDEHIGTIRRRIGLRPTLYFLDPFGVGGLKADAYPTMLEGPRNEIFALFNDVGAGRLRGIVHADSDLGAQLMEIRQSPSLFPEQDAAREAAAMAKAAHRQGVLDHMLPAAVTKISDALGSDAWIKELDGMSPDRARVELTLRFAQALLKVGARHIVFLPMRGERGEHKYFLVHASKSRAGLRAMKEAVTTGLRTDYFSATMIEAIKDDLRLPLPQARHRIQLRFGGQTVRWTEDEQSTDASVKGFLLDGTEVFDFQVPEIKDALKAWGWFQRRHRKEVCEVPVVSASGS